MQIHRMVLGMYETNCFIVYGEKENECIIIDPADNGEVIVSFLLKNCLEPKAILLTHGHYDHFCAVPILQQKWGNLPVYCHGLDIPKEKTEYDLGKVFPTVAAFQNVVHLKDNLILNYANMQIKTYHTPGHTKGSVIFVINDAMFTGDTLFKGSIGRTDFAGGSEKQMAKSLEMLGSITKNYKVFPGHEGLSTLKFEQENNPYLKVYRK